MKIFCIIVFIVIVLCMLHKNKGNGSMYNGLLLGALIYYGIAPLIMEIYKEEFIGKRSYLLMDTERYVSTYLIITVFFIIFYISNHSCLQKKDFVYAPNPNKFQKYLKEFGYFCLFVGGISLVLFFGALGGISSALAIAERARSFATELTDFMPYYASLLVIPARLVTIAPFCFWILTYLSEEKRKYKILTIISWVLTWLFLLFNAGRSHMIAMVLCVLVPFMLNRKIKHAWGYIFIAGVLSLPLLDVMDQLFVYWQQGVFELGEINYFDYISEFSHSISNVFYSFEIGNTYGYRLGKDFITCVIDFLPGVSFEPSYVPTSEFYGGTMWMITGGTPNDIITLSILEFHIFGIIIVPFALGKIIKFIDEFIKNCSDIRVSRVLTTVLAIYAFLLVSSADPSAVLRIFILWMIPLIMILSKERRIIGNNSIRR